MTSRIRTPEQRAREQERERAKRASLNPEDLERVRAREREERRRERARAKGVEYEEDAHKGSRLMLLPPMHRDWPRDAACHGMDPRLFWSPTERRNATPDISDVQLLRDQQTVALVCDRCPVQKACYADGLSNRHATGVWGGRLLGHGQPINLISRLHQGRLYRQDNAA